MENIKDQLANGIQEVEDGNLNPVEYYANLDVLEKFVKKCKEQIQEDALTEAENYGAKTFKDFGFEITIRNGATTYDYSDNQELNDLKGKVKAITDNLKLASKKGVAIVDLESGETFEPCPIKSGSKTSLTIKKI